MQSFRVALSAVCECYDPGGHYRFNDLIGVPEFVNVLDCTPEGIRHQLNVSRFEHCVADEWNYGGHARPFALKGSTSAKTSLYKIDHFLQRAIGHCACGPDAYCSVHKS
jgi:hypothetical protein